MADGSRYQDKAEKHGKWKVRLKYAAGLAALAFTVLLALFLPGWYSGWREEEVMEQVVLEKREGIRLLDMEALDIGTKLAMLGDSEEFSYSVMNELTNIDETKLQYQKILDEQFAEWYECHLIPEHPFPVRNEEEEFWNFSLDAYVRIDAGVIPVEVLIRTDNWGDDVIEIAILDQSNDFLYYAGIVSEEMLDYAYQNMGIATEDELRQKLEDGTYSLDLVRDPSWYDYASVCGADSQEVKIMDPAGFFQRITLHYEEFDVSAFRSLLDAAWAVGVQTMFGTDRWAELAYSITVMYMGYTLGPYDYYLWIDEWNDMVLKHGRDDLLFIPEEEPEIAAMLEEAGSASASGGYDEKVMQE